MWRDELREMVLRVPASQTASAIGALEGAKALLYSRLFRVNDAPARNGEPSTYNLTAAEVAQEFSLDRKWVYQHRQDLGGKKVGGAVRFSRRGVERYLASRR